MNSISNFVLDFLLLKNRCLLQALTLFKQSQYLKNSGAICVEGPKWCGKTWTSSYHANSEFLVGDPENNFSNRELAAINPSLVLNGLSPCMIDEWQEVPSLWDATRAFVDKKGDYGLIILTGSSTPKTKGIMHSGAGRIISVRMNTMSLYESGDFSGEVSLSDLVNGVFADKMVEEMNLERLAYLVVRGGWPKNIGASNPAIVPKSYVQTIIDGKLTDEKGKRFSRERIEGVLKSLARNEPTTVSVSRIAKDITEVDGKAISADTVERYIEEMDRMFLFNNQAPFDLNVRSSLRVKGAVKRRFCGPALACAILHLNEKKLLSDLNTFGFLFESLVARDLMVYAQSIGAKLYHYRNYKGEEIDAVIELDSGEWCAFEIKLASIREKEAAANLDRVCRNIVKNGGKAPLLKAVICGVAKAAYKRPDGVYVIPITALKD